MNIEEIDKQLSGYIDHSKRRYCCPSLFKTVIEGQTHSIDELLDRRNELTMEMGFEALEGFLNGTA